MVRRGKNLHLARSFSIGDFRNVFKFHAYSVNKRLFLTTAKLVRGLSDVATTNVCKVDTSNIITLKEAGEWNGWSLGMAEEISINLNTLRKSSILAPANLCKTSSSHRKEAGEVNEWLITKLKKDKTSMNLNKSLLHRTMKFGRWTVKCALVRMSQRNLPQIIWEYNWKKFKHGGDWTLDKMLCHNAERQAAVQLPQNTERFRALLAARTYASATCVSY